jgi:hypothetical protein
VIDARVVGFDVRVKSGRGIPRLLAEDDDVCRGEEEEMRRAVLGPLATCMHASSRRRIARILRSIPARVTAAATERYTVRTYSLTGTRNLTRL